MYGIATMEVMIEVEIRGTLTDEEYETLSSFLKKEGELVESQEREMILLRGYDGYSPNPNERDVDIRLRNTNGVCEIMVKRKTSDHNVARHEASLPLGCTDLEPAKEAMKALGYSEGLWMHRKKDVYRYKNIEWSIVDVPEGLRYFEAEQEVHDPSEAEAVHLLLTKEAEALGLKGMGPEEMRDFISKLDSKVNKQITW